MKKSPRRFRSGTFSKSYAALVISIVLLLVFAISTLVDYVPYTNSSTDLSWPYPIEKFASFVDKIDQIVQTERNQTDELVKNGVRRGLDYASIANIMQRFRREGQNIAHELPLKQFSNFTHIKIPSDVLKAPAGKISITIVVKSAVSYYHKRDAIRRSWFLNRSIGSFHFTTYFMVGACDKINPVPKSLPADWSPIDCEKRIMDEASRYNDLIQSSAVDSYYNNTIKTVMTLKWVLERHPTDFILGIDDDYAFEVENFLRCLKSFALDRYPMKEESDLNQTVFTYLKQLSQDDLYAGYVQNRPIPRRFRYDKWHVSRNEYPFNRFPAFVTGGLLMLSQKTARQLYIATYFKKSFKFDDVYLGILAHELGIKSLHDDKAMCSREEYVLSGDLSFNPGQCIGAHDIDSQVIIDIWKHRQTNSN